MLLYNVQYLMARVIEEALSEDKKYTKSAISSISTNFFVACTPNITFLITSSSDMLLAFAVSAI